MGGGVSNIGTLRDTQSVEGTDEQQQAGVDLTKSQRGRINAHISSTTTEVTVECRKKLEAHGIVETVECSQIDQVASIIDDVLQGITDQGLDPAILSKTPSKVDRENVKTKKRILERFNYMSQKILTVNDFTDIVEQVQSRNSKIRRGGSHGRMTHLISFFHLPNFLPLPHQ